MVSIQDWRLRVTRSIKKWPRYNWATDTRRRSGQETDPKTNLGSHDSDFFSGTRKIFRWHLSGRKTENGAETFFPRIMKTYDFEKKLEMWLLIQEKAQFRLSIVSMASRGGRHIHRLGNSSTPTKKTSRIVFKDSLIESIGYVASDSLVRGEGLKGLGFNIVDEFSGSYHLTDRPSMGRPRNLGTTLKTNTTVDPWKSWRVCRGW